MSKNGNSSEGRQLQSLINVDSLNAIKKIYSKMSQGNEFEIMFFNYNGSVMSYDRYLGTLSYLTQRSKTRKLELISSNSLDIIYTVDDLSYSYRISINGLENINKYMKMLHQRKNHVIFRVLSSLLLEGTKDLTIIKKVKNKENVIDVDDFNMRFRLAEELKVKDKELEQLVSLSELERGRVIFRFKERVSLIVNKNDDHMIRVDLTKTKMTKNINRTENTLPRYELEIELDIQKKPNDEYLKTMINESEILLKLLQQSNFITSQTEANLVKTEYCRILGLDVSKVRTLEARKPQSLEIQHVTETLPNKYAPTDKADGERYFLIIVHGNVYLMSNLLEVKHTGIVLSESSKYNDSVLDGEHIFIGSKGRYIYMIFDCLYCGTEDVRKKPNLLDRLVMADEIVKKCFVMKGQTGFDIKNYNGEFKLNDILSFHSKQIEQNMNALNHDIDIEKQFLLIRRKYFIPVYGGKDFEVFKYAELMWNKYVYDKKINCPYKLDGIMFHPLDQAYVTKDTKLIEYKWKPADKNSIDFFIRFEKDMETNKVLTVYDNSIDEYIKNKPYRICHLYVGQQQKSKDGEKPVLFRKEENKYLAHLFLKDGEVRDQTGHILQDGTVVEFCYNDDITVDEKFRWMPLRTRHDKTEIVLRQKRGYGNYIDIANKVWRSITNPILMTDISLLADDKTNVKHMELLRSKIGHDLIILGNKEDAYHQITTNLAKPMRNFHNWLKDLSIRTYCAPMYQSTKKLTILDLACGTGGDLMKFYFAQAEFYVGIDINYNSLNSALDGAISRYTKFRNQHPNFPKMYFINADLSIPLNFTDQSRSIVNMSTENKALLTKFFPEEKTKRTMFDRITCQFAIHYFFKNDETWTNFKNTVSMGLKPNGYMIVTTFDARTAIKLLGDSDQYTQYYVNEKGEKKVLFDIVKKFDQVDLSKPIGTGYPIDFHNALISRENVYNTEYLVDNLFLKNDLFESCGLKLVDTDLFSNQFELHRRYFQTIVKHEEEKRTREYLMHAGEYYNQQDEVNKACYELTKLNRYYIFRKIDDNDNQNKQGNVANQPVKQISKQNQLQKTNPNKIVKLDNPNKPNKSDKSDKSDKLPKQSRLNSRTVYSSDDDEQSFKLTNEPLVPTSDDDLAVLSGGSSPVTSPTEQVIDDTNVFTELFNKEKYYIGDAINESSYFASIFDILQNDEVIPKNLTQEEFYHDLGIKVIPDTKLDKKGMYTTCKKLRISHDVERDKRVTTQLILNGLNVLTIEADCNGFYDVSLISKNNKVSKLDKSIILLQEGSSFRPIFKITKDNYIGLHIVNDKVVESLIKVAG
jgi:SAM-dependent methyltransferase